MNTNFTDTSYWKHIDDDAGILVSINGEVYNLYKNCFVNQYTLGKYLACSINGKRYLIHRLVLQTFCPTNNMETLVVNHINSIKTDNRLCNLEWCTTSYNTKYAYEHGEITNHGIKNRDIFKHVVCLALQDGKSTKEIAEMLNINYNDNFKKMISKVRSKYRWKNVSKYYNISPAITSSTIIENICSLINDNNSITARDIAAVLNIEYTSSFDTLISSIKNHKQWTSISSKYNF